MLRPRRQQGLVLSSGERSQRQPSRPPLERLNKRLLAHRNNPLLGRSSRAPSAHNKQVLLSAERIRQQLSKTQPHSKQPLSASAIIRRQRLSTGLTLLEQQTSNNKIITTIIMLNSNNNKVKPHLTLFWAISRARN